MAKGEVRLESSFELLSQDEWDAYLSVDYFDKLRIDQDALRVSEGGLPNLQSPRLAEMIKEHNNKVGALATTYALCRHYFDKGIPDDPWCVSPGSHGSSMQYMPLFQQEHWGRQFWFGYFSEVYYLKMFSIWDSVIQILNHYYGLNYKSDFRLRSRVMNWLKANSTKVFCLLNEIADTGVHKEAKRFRNAAAHDVSPNAVSKTVKCERGKFEYYDGMDQHGRMIKKWDILERISLERGDYTNVATIMENMGDYAMLLGITIEGVVCELTLKT